MQLYILRNNAPTGPFSEVQIFQWRKTGIVNDETLVSVEGSGSWTQLGKLMTFEPQVTLEPVQNLTASKKQPDATKIREHPISTTITGLTSNLFARLSDMNTRPPPP